MAGGLLFRTGLNCAKNEFTHHYKSPIRHTLHKLLHAETSNPVMSGGPHLLGKDLLL